MEKVEATHPIIDWAEDSEDIEEDEKEEESWSKRRVLKAVETESNDNKRKRQKSDSEGSDDKKRSSRAKRSLNQMETDPVILERRQKTIDYGKNTVGYTNYRKLVSLEQRTKAHPRTPDKYYKYSRRSWDTLIKVWRKELHVFDPKSNEAPTRPPKGETDSNDSS